MVSHKTFAAIPMATKDARAPRRYAAVIDGAGEDCRIRGIPHNTEDIHGEQRHEEMMLTLRGQYRRGQVQLLEEVPLDGECQVLVTFLGGEGLEDAPRALRNGTSRAASLAACSISEREYEVLELLHSGATNREIAAALGIQPGTVRNHTSSIYEKLGVRNRLEAVAHAVELGVLGREH